MILALSLGVSLLSLLLFMKMADRVGLLDRPNDRSQHNRPTVVGGGIAVALSCSVTLVVLDAFKPALFDLYQPHTVWILAGLGMCLALTGLADDRFNLPSGPRLVIYLLCAAGFLLFAGSSMGLVLTVATVLLLVWVINLFNFMDGADGYATTQALSVCVGLAILAWIVAPEATVLPLAALILASALLPLMWFNWPPAKLFMGDAGAVYIGSYLGVLGLLAYVTDVRLACVWLILMMPFLVDASLTLVIRLKGGHLPHVAHRDHAYQRLIEQSQSSLHLNIALLMVQGVWLFPLAAWAAIGNYSPWIAVILSAIPFVLFVAYQRRTP